MWHDLKWMCWSEGLPSRKVFLQVKAEHIKYTLKLCASKLLERWGICTKTDVQKHCWLYAWPSFLFLIFMSFSRLPWRKIPLGWLFRFVRVILKESEELVWPQLTLTERLRVITLEGRTLHNSSAVVWIFLYLSMFGVKNEPLWSDQELRSLGQLILS